MTAHIEYLEVKRDMLKNMVSAHTDIVASLKDRLKEVEDELEKEKNDRSRRLLDLLEDVPPQGREGEG